MSWESVDGDSWGGLPLPIVAVVAHVVVAVDSR